MTCRLYFGSHELTVGVWFWVGDGAGRMLFGVFWT